MQRPNGSKAPTALIWSVLDYRQNFLPGSIPVDPCSVMAVMERPGAFEDSISTPFARQFERAAAACSAAPTQRPTNRKTFRMIRFDSVAIADSSAKAYLTVIDDENHHLEEYDLRRVHGTLSGIKSVRLFNALRVEAR
jgi:hypothetical protein